jgi:ribonuclease HI
VEQVSKNIELDITSDTKYTIDGLTKNLKKARTKAISTANKAVIKLTAAKLRTRKAKTRIKWVEGHSGTPGGTKPRTNSQTRQRKRRQAAEDVLLPGADKERGRADDGVPFPFHPPI